MTNKQRAHNWGYANRCRKRRDSAQARQKLIEPVLPDEMTPEGVAMEVELEHRRVKARKEALRSARLKRHKIFAIQLQGGTVKP
jgi:hypothetical protein